MLFNGFTDRARTIVDLASEEARRLGDVSVGTIHLLIGMTREKNGIAGITLSNHDIDADTVLENRSIVCGEPDVTLAEVQTRSQLEAKWFGHHFPGTEHLLLGLCCLNSCRAAQLLERLGKHPRQLCHFVVEILGHEDQWERWLTDHPEFK